jgi:hypothetical protein
METLAMIVSRDEMFHAQGEAYRTKKELTDAS